MKIERIRRLSNKYSVIKQVYEDRVLIRTNNILYSKKYFSYMFLLTNHNCIWTRNVLEIAFGENQYDTLDTYLVEVRKADFERVKTYTDSFRNINISEQDEITEYEQLIKIAKEQEEQDLVCKIY